MRHIATVCCTSTEYSGVATPSRAAKAVKNSRGDGEHVQSPEHRGGADRLDTECRAAGNDGNRASAASAEAEGRRE